MKLEPSCLEVHVQGATSIHWARLSGDGQLLIASVGVGAPGRAEASSIAAIDMQRGRELWRVELSSNGRVEMLDAAVLSSRVVLVITPGSGAPPAVELLGSVPARVGPRYPIETREAQRRRYWLLPRQRTIVAAEKDGHIAGISVDDGSIRWRLAAADQMIVGGSKQAWLVAVRETTINVYGVPEPSVP